MDINTILNLLNKEKTQLELEIHMKQTRLIEIDIIVNNLNQLKNDIGLICDKCHGKGKVFSRSCAEDEGDWYHCKKCNGSGRLQL